MQRIVVFCGSSPGFSPVFGELAFALGKALAERGIGLVYGGAQIGLMGAVADGALQNGGEVIGVLPHFLGSKEIAHPNLTELIMVDTMHQRKTIMNDLSDGVIALPGGFGTLEELFEMLTWAQLGLHPKPIGLLNINNFYSPLIEMTSQMVGNGFLKKSHQDLLLTAENISDLIQLMDNFQALPQPKWLSRETT